MLMPVKLESAPPGRGRTDGLGAPVDNTGEDTHLFVPVSVLQIQSLGKSLAIVCLPVLCHPLEIGLTLYHLVKLICQLIDCQLAL